MGNKKHTTFHGHNFDQIEHLIQDNFEKACERSPYVPEPDIDDEPQYFSYITLDVELERYCTDVTGIFDYNDAQTMQQSFLSWVKTAVTPELLEHVRAGHIKNLTVRIGPNTLSGRNMHEDY